MNVNSVASVLIKKEILGNMKNSIRKQSPNRHTKECPSKSFRRKRKQAGTERLDIRTNNSLTQSETGCSGMVVPQLAITGKHSCWICQEEMGSDDLLHRHYENHMRRVHEDGL